MTDEYQEEFDDSVEESSDNFVDDDDLSPEEEGFMRGYDEAGEIEADEDEVDKEFE